MRPAPDQQGTWHCLQDRALQRPHTSVLHQQPKMLKAPDCRNQACRCTSGLNHKSGSLQSLKAYQRSCLRCNKHTRWQPACAPNVRALHLIGGANEGLYQHKLQGLQTAIKIKAHSHGLAWYIAYCILPNGIRVCSTNAGLGTTRAAGMQSQKLLHVQPPASRGAAHLKHLLVTAPFTVTVPAWQQSAATYPESASMSCESS